MGSVTDDWPVVETEPVKDIFATEIAEIEIMGTNARFVFCAVHHVPGTTHYERVIVAKFVVPIKDALAMMDFCRAALQPAPNVVLFQPRH